MDAWEKAEFPKGLVSIFQKLKYGGLDIKNYGSAVMILVGLSHSFSRVYLILEL